MHARNKSQQPLILKLYDHSLFVLQLENVFNGQSTSATDEERYDEIVTAAKDWTGDGIIVIVD